MNSNGTPDNISLNSCQYTPVYLIQNNSITQARSYVLAPPIKEEQRPVSNNLKLFYENSGNIENGIVVNNVQYVSNTPVPKQVQESPGNNLKLASFLVPKKDANKQQYIATISNKILKPTVSSSNTNILPNINIITPKVIGGRNKANNAPRTLLKPRILPKITPKEKIPEPTKHTSVQLLKFGGTYHSLNQLSPEQMRLVTKALEKIPGDPKRAALKPTFDADSNTKIVYKVVAPGDLKVIGKNKIILRTNSIKKEDLKVKSEKLELEEEPAEVITEVKMTRSGRTVKLPKHIQDEQEGPPPKAKKKINTFTCYTCSTEFPSIYRLQRHYDNRPGHLPVDVHSSLFRCLVAMTERDVARGGAPVFVDHLDQLVQRLRALLPCLMNNTAEGAEGTPCTVSEDVGRIFGVNPGVYNFNVDALTCVKDSDGYCKHSPKPSPVQFTEDLSKPSQLWLSKHQEETANVDEDGENCARINSVDKWAKKRVWKHKVDKTESKQANKKVKLNSDSSEFLIELGSETCDAIAKTEPNDLTEDDLKSDKNDCRSLPLLTESPIKAIDTKTHKGSHKQFYSTHFDIRSSPIKPSSAVFNKFQIKPEKLPMKFDTQLLRPLTFEQNDQAEETGVHNSSDSSLDLNGIFDKLNQNVDDHSAVSPEITDNVSCKETDELNNISFANPKEWTLSENSVAQDNSTKPNNLIVPSMMHVKDANSSCSNSTTNFNGIAVNNHDDSISNNVDMLEESRLSLTQGVSMLNFLETLGNELTCPETELRSNSMDFPLDLFSFNHS